MDAQSHTQDTAALVALTQALARFELTEGTEPPTGCCTELEGAAVLAREPGALAAAFAGSAG